jgi:hypothetical protein
MQKHAFGSILALSISAAAFAVASPAHAAPYYVWVNYASVGTATPMLLTMHPLAGNQFTIEPQQPESSARGQNLVLGRADNTHTEDAYLQMQGAGPAYWPPTGQWEPMVAGVSANNMSNGTAVITWALTGEKNPQWRAEWDVVDRNGATCWSFHNLNSPANRDVVLGVPYGKMTKGAKVVIWDNLFDATNHPDQYWCSYWVDTNAQLVPVPYVRVPVPPLF